MAKKTLGQKLKELRKIFGYTQDYMASALGISRQSYSGYENDVRNPNLPMLYKIATIFGTTADDLLQESYELDDEIIYETPSKTESGDELAQFMEFASSDANRQRIEMLNYFEKKLLFYFDRLSDDDKQEILDLAQIKVRRSKQKNDPSKS